MVFVNLCYFQAGAQEHGEQRGQLVRVKNCIYNWNDIAKTLNIKTKFIVRDPSGAQWIMNEDTFKQIKDDQEFLVEFINSNVHSDKINKKKEHPRQLSDAYIRDIINFYKEVKSSHNSPTIILTCHSKSLLFEIFNEFKKDNLVENAFLSSPSKSINFEDKMLHEKTFDVIFGTWNRLCKLNEKTRFNEGTWTIFIEKSNVLSDIQKKKLSFEKGQFYQLKNEF